jgi:hypothetical protein
MNERAIIVNNAAEQIEENSVVLSIYMDQFWIEQHAVDYLGIDKPMILLDNYEANLGWFPLRWNGEKIPNIMLSDKTQVSEIVWYRNENTPVKQIDYVVVYGNPEQLNNPEYQELKELLDADFLLDAVTKNYCFSLYKRR